jgi:hydroxypyruvate isomerase
LQLDLSHVQIMEGDLAHRIRALAGHYPHVQIAGNPGRHEPDVGEINYRYLFDLFDERGYAGWIGIPTTAKPPKPRVAPSGMSRIASSELA